MIDRDAIAAALGFSRSDMDMVLALFINDATVSVEKLEQAVEDHDMASVADAAHAIKGSAGNFKLDSLYEEAKAMEAAAKEAPDSFDFAAALERIKTLLKEI